MTLDDNPILNYQFIMNQEEGLHLCGRVGLSVWLACFDDGGEDLKRIVSGGVRGQGAQLLAGDEIRH